VNSSELVFSLFLIVLLLALAGYFAWRQVQTLRGLRAQPQPSAEDRRYLRRQAVRRLVCCALMLVLAGLLVGSVILEPRYQALTRTLEENQPAKPEDVPQEDREFARFFTAYWIAALFVLFVLIALAAVDFWAIARFGMRHRRQLQADHRALLHEELARLRSRRNGESIRSDEPPL
jgi:hypothetical protein